MNRGYFITGTDTGVGKTCVSRGLMRALKARGHSVAGMKPLASGCTVSGGALRNEDALQLQVECSLVVPYEQVNPYALEPAVAPHLAAEAVGVRLDISVMEAAYRHLDAQADVVVVEGVGGWLVPVNSAQTMADVAVRLALPVIMVVGIRLGCLNHALLTAAAIRGCGARLAGWVANRIDPDCQWQDENVRALLNRLDAPLLADIGYVADESARDGQFEGIDVGRLPVS